MVYWMGFVDIKVSAFLSGHSGCLKATKVVARAPQRNKLHNKGRSYILFREKVTRQDRRYLSWNYCCLSNTEEEKSNDTQLGGEGNESVSTDQQQADSSLNGTNRAPSFSLPTMEGTVEPRLSLFPPQPTTSEEERLARIREISNLPEGTFELEWNKAEQLSQLYEETHPWPAFLRATVYERYERFEQAVEEMNQSIMSGLNLPDPLERRASIFLRMGRWKDAVDSFDEATVLNIYGLGNELSSLHEIREEIEPYLPEWSGPPLNIQRATAYYFMERYDDARECVAIDGLLDKQTTEGALWVLAIKAKSSDKNSAIAEATEDWVKPKVMDDSLGKLWQLYTTPSLNISGLEKELEQLPPNISCVACFYMGLYFDSFESDSQQRDKWWKKTCDAKLEKKHFWQWIAEAKLA
ncbi:hypothetical protein GpartN1_g5889.t1 [Galdieria partita]|uniref:Uncharacterized protein n=1 Tax=Galdieria partita TaxID=83374 RepID=A0A9C7Q060_9RHOD|nr:hypothetical protein GpartN1_g5889.t1 [Galdieria partita]